ncbi:MAG: hypothetical protein K0Q79_324 [Flavipsychrobacter sp.]|jgi:tetratricopeptide (TPR) repeat protein|nr:hypothetical protein [Flavipsychrobacter sp.]
MLSPADDNFQFSYQLLLLFLSRPGEQGYMFCRSDDQRFTHKINASLKSDLAQKGRTCAVVYLDKNSDEPLLPQLEKAVSADDALIVANLFEIVNDTEHGSVYLTQLNFAREALWQIDKPILFWTDARSMHTIANQAPDLYSQRRHTTVHFTGTADVRVAERLNKDGWESFLSSKEFADIETNINILEKRLIGAVKGNYPMTRTVAEIVLPLVADYAKLGLADEARELMTKYEDVIRGMEDENTLRQVADIRYALHEYDDAIETLRKANELIAEKSEGNDYPVEWFVNLTDIARWSMEAGRSEGLLPEITRAIDLLAKRLKNEQQGWSLYCLLVLSGDIHSVLGKLPDARKFYEQGLSISKQLAANNPHSQLLQNGLSIAYNKLGDALSNMGHLSEARNYYEQGLKLNEQLVEMNPNSEQPQRHLGISYCKLGDIVNAMGQLNEARSYYEQYMRLSERLAAANPHSEELQRDLGISNVRLAELKGNTNAALRYYKDALGIFEQLSAANPLSRQLKDDIAYTKEQLAALEK